MLVPCPECNANVSDCAPYCPHCGAIIAFPAFYATVRSDGLTIISLIYDWYNFQDDSAFGSGCPVVLILQSYDEDMTRLTCSSAHKLAGRMSDRLALLPNRSAEYRALQLTRDYVRIVRRVAELAIGMYRIDQDLRWDTKSIESSHSKCVDELQTLLSRCNNTEDTALIQKELNALMAHGPHIRIKSAIAAGHIKAPPKLVPLKSQPSSFLKISSSTLTLIIFAIIVALIAWIQIR